MASPDLSTYIDLTLYDKTPTEIADDAIEYAQTVLPEFTPKTGTVEDALIQASAQMTSELVGSINRMTPGMMEVLLQLFDIERVSGTQATGTILITVVDDLGYTIDAGTQFGYLDTSDPEDPQLYVFGTDADTVIAYGNTTGNASVTATVYSESPPLEAGQALQLLTPTSFISSGVLSVDLVVGADPETDAEYFTRAVAALNSYTQALVLPAQMQQYILANYPTVVRCKAYSRVNSINDDWADAAENGYVTIYVASPGGASLTLGAMTLIEEAVTTKSTAGLSIDVKAPLIQAVTLAVGVTIKSTYTAAVVEDSIQAALDGYLHPDFWEWGQTVYYNELISLIDQVAGVDRVVSLTINAATTNYSFTRRGTLPSHVTDVTVS